MEKANQLWNIQVFKWMAKNIFGVYKLITRYLTLNKFNWGKKI